MVRLIEHGKDIGIVFKTFQFQRGTIDSIRSVMIAGEPMLFQFQRGTIDRSEEIPAYIPASEFQFQRGTIDSRFVKDFKTARLRFNSSVVRLIVGTVIEQIQVLKVSIPAWYD